jgi:small subunit ribosomal protein S16
MGKIRNPQYRIVVADSRTKRDGKAIEFIGIYHPKEDPSLIEVKSDRVQYWLGVGAQPSEPVKRSSPRPVTGRSSRACRLRPSR